MYPWQQQQRSSFSLRESSSSSAPQKHPAQTDGAPASAAGLEVVDDSSGQNRMPPAKRPREFQSFATGAPSSWENAYPAPWENRGASAAGGSTFGQGLGQGLGQRPAATASRWGGVTSGAGAMGRGVTNIKFTDTGRSSGGVGAGVTRGGGVVGANGGGSATEATGGEGAKDNAFINQFQRSAHIHGGGGAGGMASGMNHMQNLLLQAAAGQGQVN
jgi:hypothetical protein